MRGSIGRLVAALLLGWLALVLAAAGVAYGRKRAAVTPETDADEIDLVAAFGPLAFRSTASAFRGGRVETWFGGGVLDLRSATLDPMGATLEVNAVFGGGQLVVPADWNVELGVTGIGGAGDARRPVERSADAPTLRVEGLVLFGGWGVSSERGDGHDEQVAAPV